MGIHSLMGVPALTMFVNNKLVASAKGNESILLTRSVFLLFFQLGSKKDNGAREEIGKKQR